MSSTEKKPLLQFHYGKSIYLLTENEIMFMLRANPGIMETALKRGKGQKRLEKAYDR